VIDRVGRAGVKFVVMLCIRIVRKRNGRCCVLGKASWECWSEICVGGGVVFVRNWHVKWSCMCKENQWKLKWSIGYCWNIG
jgi:hypothetical protein